MTTALRDLVAAAPALFSEDTQRLWREWQDRLQAHGAAVARVEELKAALARLPRADRAAEIITDAGEAVTEEERRLREIRRALRDAEGLAAAAKTAEDTFWTACTEDCQRAAEALRRAQDAILEPIVPHLGGALRAVEAARPKLEEIGEQVKTWRAWDKQGAVKRVRHPAAQCFGSPWGLLDFVAVIYAGKPDLRTH